MTLFAFVDTETTGLDPDKDHLLEVAWTLTREDFVPLFEPRSFLVTPGDWDLRLAAISRITGNEFVYTMHRKSGLLDDWLFRDDDSTGKEWVTAEAAATVFRGDIDAAQEAEGDDDVHLAGYSVSFDRDFLRANGWRSMLEYQVNHRLLDLSATTVLLKSQGIEVDRPVNDNPHRAATDVLESVEYAQMLRKHLSS